MLFRGSYEVTRKLKGQDIESTRTSILKDVNVGGTFKLSPTQIFDAGANKLTNLALPAAASDASTKGYVDSAVRHIHVGIDAPSNALGQHEDIYFRGTLGGTRILNGIAGGNITDLSSDGDTILVTTDAGTGQYYSSTDSGLSWKVFNSIADPTNTMRYIVSTGKGRFIIVRKKVGNGTSPSIFTSDSGTTWQQSTHPAVPVANLTKILVDKDNANSRAVLLFDAGKPQYSIDHGQTWLLSNAPAGNYQLGAINGTTVVITNSVGVCFKSTDGGLNYTTQGTLPAFSITWRAMSAITHDIMICVGTGTASNNIAISYNAGASWAPTVISASPIEAIDMMVNRITGTISVVGNTGIAMFANVNDLTAWYPASRNDLTYVSRDIDTHGAGFVGVSYGVTPTVAMSADGTAWSTENAPGFVELFANQGGKWVIFDVLQQQEADARYVRSSGGIINGNLGLNNHVISGVANPVNSQDAVNLGYLNTHLNSVSGTFIPAEIGTLSSVVDRVSRTVETFKYIISAKVGTKRYYSEMNVIANGFSDPVSAEYSVMSILGLDIQSTVSKASNGDTELSIVSSDPNTTVFLKRIVIDF